MSAGPPKSGYITGSVWERVLIGIFGAALMLIGANHFQEPYGGIVSFLKNKGKVFAGGGGDDFRPYKSRSSTYQAEGFYVETVDQETGRRSKIVPMPVEVQKELSKKKTFKGPSKDAVTSHDRKELNQLLNDL